MRRTLLLPLMSFAVLAAGPQFQLRDSAGGAHSNAEWTGQKAVVLFFVATDCPVGNSYVPEMNRIRDAYTSRGVLVYAVQAETTVADTIVAQYAREYAYRFPL